MTRAGTRRGLAIRNVREPASPDDGRRILVDRLWPRGASKSAAHVDEWMRDLAPSTELRRWFAHDPARWDSFRRRYRQELIQSGAIATLEDLRKRARRERITLVFGARDHDHNNAVALLEVAGETRTLTAASAR